MTIHFIESLMANMAEILMMPVLLIISGLFIYSLYAFGQFASLAFIRRKNQTIYLSGISKKSLATVRGYDLHNQYVKDSSLSEDELEIYALKQMENLRMVTRIAPMLGLIATMIPMGPALQALADGNVQGISENLIIAFAAVIWSLAISSVTFWPASVRKRWLAEELVNVRKLRGE